MIEQMYGKSVFYEDAANALIPDAYDKALEECEEQIVSSPKIDVTQLEAGKPFIFTAEVALKPEVTLGKYKGVKVDKIDVKVSDEDIDAEINRERESNAHSGRVICRPDWHEEPEDYNHEKRRKERMKKQIIPIERASESTINALIEAGVLVVTEDGLKCAEVD